MAEKWTSKFCFWSGWRRMLYSCPEHNKSPDKPQQNTFYLSMIYLIWQREHMHTWMGVGWGEKGREREKERRISNRFHAEHAGFNPMILGSWPEPISRDRRMLNQWVNQAPQQKHISVKIIYELWTYGNVKELNRKGSLSYLGPMNELGEPAPREGWFIRQEETSQTLDMYVGSLVRFKSGRAPSTILSGNSLYHTWQFYESPEAGYGGCMT